MSGETQDSIHTRFNRFRHLLAATCGFYKDRTLREVVVRDFLQCGDGDGRLWKWVRVSKGEGEGGGEQKREDGVGAMVGVGSGRWRWQRRHCRYP